MEVDIVLIDVLREDGVVHTYKYRPNNADWRFSIDRLADIDPMVRDESQRDIVGVRFYENVPRQLLKFKSRLFAKSDDGMSFSFEFHHTNVRLSQNPSPLGLYNLVLARGSRLTELRIEDAATGKELNRKVWWNKEKKTQLVELPLQTDTGSISLTIRGKSWTVAQGSEHVDYIPAGEISSVGEIPDPHLDRDIEPRGPGDRLAGIRMDQNDLIRNRKHIDQHTIEEKFKFECLSLGLQLGKTIPPDVLCRIMTKLGAYRGTAENFNSHVQAYSLGRAIAKRLGFARPQKNKRP